MKKDLKLGKGNQTVNIGTGKGEPKQTASNQQETNGAKQTTMEKKTSAKKGKDKKDELKVGKFSDFSMPQGMMGGGYFTPGMPNNFQPSNKELLEIYTNNSMFNPSTHQETIINRSINEEIKIEFQVLTNLKHRLEKMYIQKDSDKNANLIIKIKEYSSDMFENENFEGIDIFIAIPIMVKGDIFKGKMLLNQFTGFGLTQVSAFDLMKKLKELFEVSIVLV